MKLPEDPKDRIKVLLLSAVGAIAVLYGIFGGVVFPMLRKKGEKKDAIETLRRDLDGARREIRTAINQREENARVIREIIHLTRKKGVVLLPRLGNFLLGATEALERSAKKVGLKLESVREIGISEVVKNPEKETDNTFKQYTARVSLECGFHDLIAFLGDIEENNPYLCLTSVTVSGQRRSPGKHRVTLDVQWPIWADQETDAKLDKKLAEAQAFRPESEEQASPEPDKTTIAESDMPEPTSESATNEAIPSADLEPPGDADEPVTDEPPKVEE